MTAGSRQTGWTWTNEPRRLAVADYERARTWLIERVRTREDVAALFEYGSCGAPGLSDLDVIVVLSETPRPDIADYLGRAQWPADFDAVLDGATLMIMSETDFPRILCWDDVELVQRWGRPLPVHPVEAAAARFTEGCRIVDWLPWHVSRLARLQQHRQLPLRRTTGLLHSLTYSLRRLDAVFGIRRPGWEAYSAQVQRLRQRWFADPDAGRRLCAGLVLEAHHVARQALEIFGREIAGTPEWYGADASGCVGRLLVPGGIELQFTDAPARRRGRAGPPSRGPEWTVTGLPAVLYRHFAAYASEEGLISRALRQAMDPPPAADAIGPVHGELRRVLRERMRLCDRWAGFLQAHGFSTGLFKFAWFYRPLGEPVHATVAAG
jgi:hypothetical protein